MAKGSSVLGSDIRGVVGEIVGRVQYGQQIWQKRTERGTMAATDRMREWRSWEGAGATWLSQYYYLYRELAVWPTRAANLWCQWTRDNLANTSVFAFENDFSSWFWSLTWEWDFFGVMDGANFNPFDPYWWEIDWQGCWNIPWQQGGTVRLISFSICEPYMPRYEVIDTDATQGIYQFEFNRDLNPPKVVGLTYKPPFDEKWAQLLFKLP